MRLIDADWLLSFIRLDEKVIAPEQHTAQDIIMMVQAAPTIEPPPNEPLTLEELREMDGAPVWGADGKCYIVNDKAGYAVDKDRGFRLLWEDGFFYRRKPEEGTT